MSISVKKKKINPKELQKSYMEKIEQSLTDDGVIFFEPTVNLNISEDYLILPPLITDVPPRELGEYMNAFTQQKMYLRTLLGRIECELEEAKRNYLDSSEGIYAQLSSTKLSETAKERLINADESVKEHYNHYSDYLRKQSLVKSNIANIEDAIFLISREISRRNADFDDESRTLNLK